MLSKTLYRRYKTLLQNTQERFVEEENIINNSVKKLIVIAILLTAASSLISYTLVLTQEKALQDLHSETMLTQMENIDIKNDVDFTRGLYNVHNKAKTLTNLKKPDKIIEVDLAKGSLNVDVDVNDDLTVNRIVIGY